MKPAVWVAPGEPLPDPRQAGPEGLVAVGMDLSTERLREAYAQGLFPWFNEGDPVLWWSPDPRMVLACADFKVSRSLGKKLRQLERNESLSCPALRVTTNLAFTEVMRACAGPRKGANGTWILPPLQQVYTDWHELGYVHSIETWQEGELVGGLYGVCLGRMFFGESMFSRATDASKIALAYLVNFLRRNGVTHIDCQQETGHLASLGAQPLGRDDFLSFIKGAINQAGFSWGRGVLYQDGRLLENKTEICAPLRGAGGSRHAVQFAHGKSQID